MTERQRLEFELLLRADRAMLLRQLRRVNPPASVLAKRAASFPGDDGQAAAAGASSDDDTAVAAHDAASLAEIDAALHLLETNPERFGICDECGARIELHRLRLVPTTRVCGRHTRGR